MTSARKPPRPSDDFANWPPSAQQAYLDMKAKVKVLKGERELLRLKHQTGRRPEVLPAELADIESVDELTLPWTSMMDGRIHRLKRHQHFDGEVSAVVEEARLAARLSRRGVLALREQMGPKYEYVWVQFTDHAILVGDPCPCGGRKLTRLHNNLARCRRCGKTSTLTPR
ncbi:MAG TPA: hypothetical protein VI300_09370 [Solirubrobacter sp.]